MRDELAFRSEREADFRPKIVQKNRLFRAASPDRWRLKRRSTEAREYSIFSRKPRIGIGWTGRRAKKPAARKPRARPTGFTSKHSAGFLADSQPDTPISPANFAAYEPLVEIPVHHSRPSTQSSVVTDCDPWVVRLAWSAIESACILHVSKCPGGDRNLCRIVLSIILHSLT